MTQSSTPDPNSQPQQTPEKKPAATRRTPIWLAIFLPLASILLFFFLLEGSLFLAGVKTAPPDQDPFVGFSSDMPLYVPKQGPDGQQLLTTAANKIAYFNPQTFPARKAPGTYRIFTLGGSTTYGRPYNDATSFSGWLRELLPVADRQKNWEVINAGGVSYASYRVAHLMEELVNYQPDLFVIYTGHNEFLEERTYGKIKEIPPLVRTTVSLLSKTRTWTALSSAVERIKGAPPVTPQPRETLGVEVNTILDNSAGLKRYTRDDPLKENILEHYRISLERMADMARSTGARVIFVTPASSLNDCSPFKSEHTAGLDPATRERSANLLAAAKQALRQEQWSEALALLDSAVALDPRHAELHYRRAQALLALGKMEEADTAFVKARDEDVCPLRALTPMQQIVIDVAREKKAGLVDYITLLEQRMQDTKGYRSPGAELFLDHVHPSIEAHKLLAVALVENLIQAKVVTPGREWGEAAIAAVAQKIDERTDTQAHGQALANLARVYLWAGKDEDAARLARQAQELAGDIRQIFVDSSSILASVLLKSGRYDEAVEQMFATLRKAPGAMEVRLKLGQTLVDRRYQRWEEAAANLLLVCQQIPNFEPAFADYGMAMARRGQLEIAYYSLSEALRLNPKDTKAQNLMAQIRPYFGDQLPKPARMHIGLEVYPSNAPHKVAQFRIDERGIPVQHGAEVEFYENGRLKRFVDMGNGQRNGLDMSWDESGKLLSSTVYQQGEVVENVPAN